MSFDSIINNGVFGGQELFTVGVKYIDQFGEVQDVRLKNAINFYGTGRIGDMSTKGFDSEMYDRMVDAFENPEDGTYFRTQDEEIAYGFIEIWMRKSAEQFEAKMEGLRARMLEINGMGPAIDRSIPESSNESVEEVKRRLAQDRWNKYVASSEPKKYYLDTPEENTNSVEELQRSMAIKNEGVVHSDEDEYDEYDEYAQTYEVGLDDEDLKDENGNVSLSKYFQKLADAIRAKNEERE